MGELRAAVLGATGDRADEDAVREFYLKTISVSVNRSLEDLASFATEKQGPNSIGKKIILKILTKILTKNHQELPVKKLQ